MVYYYNIYGGVKAVTDNWDKFQKHFSYFQTETLDNPNLMIKTEEIELNPDKYNMVGRFLLRERELVERRKFGTLKIKNLLSETEIHFTKGYDRFMPALNLVRDIMWFKLINLGKTLVHSASVELNGEGCLINGWMGMGKTMSTIKLVMRGFNFLGDDLVILDGEGNVHAFPLPLKLSLPHSKILHMSNFIKAKLLMGELVNKIPYLRRRIEIAHHEEITDLIENSSISENAEIKRVYILQKASMNDLVPIDYRQASKILALQNKWERIFWTDRIFIPYGFTDQDFNPTLLEGKEMKIIEQSIRKAECYKVYFTKYASDELEKILIKK